MDIDNSFELPLDPASAWATLLDIRRVLPCIPGAELLEASVDGATYKCKVSVKLGPVALAFVGTATFTERNDGARMARLQGRGNDTKGRGGVRADMTFRVTESGNASRVTVHSQVTFTGSVAQYGRGTGVMQEVASQLIAQFAANLKANLLTTQSASIASAAAPAAGLRGSNATDEPTPIGVISEAAPAAAPSQPPVPTAEPIAGVSLLFRVLWTALINLFRKRHPEANGADHGRE